MTRLSWRFRAWLMEPLMEMVKEIEMAKDKDARNELQALLEQQSKAIDALEANIAADEETDWSEMQPLLAQAGQNNAKLARMGGVNPDGSNPANPVNPRTGEAPDLGNTSNTAVEQPTTTPPANEAESNENAQSS